MAEETKKKEKLSERLHRTLCLKFGIKWDRRKPLPVSKVAVDWYWLVRLLEEGIELRRHKFLAAGNGHLDASMIASLCDFEQILENLVEQLESRLV